MCSAQFANLRKFEIALGRVLEVENQFRNCAATLRIPEIALEPALIIRTRGLSSVYTEYWESLFLQEMHMQCRIRV